MELYIDTCVMPRCRLEETVLYRQNCGTDLGFELLPMFDLPDFEENLRRNISVFAEGPPERSEGAGRCRPCPCQWLGSGKADR